MNKSEYFTTTAPDRPFLMKADEHLDLLDRVAKKQPHKLPADLAKNYEIDRSFGDEGYIDSSTGAQAFALKHKHTNKVVIGFSSMDPGLNKESERDAVAVRTGGKIQWDAVKEEVKRYQHNLAEGTQIEKIGDSLGGGIVQHAIYDDKDPNGTSKNLNITGYTYDPIGAADHIDNFDPNRVIGKDLRSLMVKGNDLHNMSGKHVGEMFHAVEPSGKVEVYSHTNGRVRESIKNTIGGSKKYIPDYRVDGKINSTSGKIAEAYIWREDEKLKKAEETLNKFGHTLKIKSKEPTGWLLSSESVPNNIVSGEHDVVNKVMNQKWPLGSGIIVEFPEHAPEDAGRVKFEDIFAQPTFQQDQELPTPVEIIANWFKR
jgi:hypothetical protein